MTRTFQIIIIALFISMWAVVVYTHDAAAQTVCGERSEIVEKLKKGYAESPISIGLASNGSIIEIFASEQGTFSIVISQPGGNSCMVAAGENWQSAPKTVKGTAL